MISHGFDWDANPEAVKKLTELWNAGQSCSQIAKALGNGITRSSVIGKAHRLKLPTHSKIPHRPPVYQKPLVKVMTKPKPKPKTATPAPPLECPKAIIPPETFGVDGQCKHIDGDPQLPEWQMCGNPVASHKSYCEYHRSKTVDLVRTAQVRAAQH